MILSSENSVIAEGFYPYSHARYIGYKIWHRHGKNKEPVFHKQQKWFLHSTSSVEELDLRKGLKITIKDKRSITCKYQSMLCNGWWCQVLSVMTRVSVSIWYFLALSHHHHLTSSHHQAPVLISHSHQQSHTIQMYFTYCCIRLQCNRSHKEKK